MLRNIFGYQKPLFDVRVSQNSRKTTSQDGSLRSRLEKMRVFLAITLWSPSIAIENGPFIVDLPIKIIKAVIFHSKLYQFTRPGRLLGDFLDDVQVLHVGVVLTLWHVPTFHARGEALVTKKNILQYLNVFASQQFTIRIERGWRMLGISLVGGFVCQCHQCHQPSVNCQGSVGSLSQRSSNL